MLSPFSDLIYPEIDTKVKQSHIFMISFIPKRETALVCNSRIIKRRSSFQCQAFLQSMTCTLSTSVYEFSVGPDLYKKTT